MLQYMYKGRYSVCISEPSPVMEIDTAPEPQPYYQAVVVKAIAHVNVYAIADY